MYLSVKTTSWNFINYTFCCMKCKIYPLTTYLQRTINKILVVIKKESLAYKLFITFKLSLSQTHFLHVISGMCSINLSLLPRYCINCSYQRNAKNNTNVLKLGDKYSLNNK